MMIIAPFPLRPPPPAPAMAEKSGGGGYPFSQPPMGIALARKKLPTQCVAVCLMRDDGGLGARAGGGWMEGRLVPVFPSTYRPQSFSRQMGV